MDAYGRPFVYINMQCTKLFTEGQKLHQAGNLSAALRYYDKALSLNPKLADARMYKALVLQQTGRISAAVEEAQIAISHLKKDDIGVLVTYGIVMKNANRLDDAKRAYEKVLTVNPNIQSAIANLATIDLLQGNLDSAENGFKKLSLTLHDASAWLNLTRIAMLRSDNESAKEYLARAEDYDPSHPDGLMLRAKLAADDKDDETAANYCIKGLEKAPANREIWNIFQTLDSEEFNLDQLEKRLNELAKLSVQSTGVLSVAVDLCRKNWIWNPLDKLENMLSRELMGKVLDKVPSASDVFTLLGANISQESHLQVAKACWGRLTFGISKGLFNLKDRRIKSKVRVGFLSSDLRGHAIGHLAVGLLESLPKSKIEWWAYSNSSPENSKVSDRLRNHFDRFIHVNKLSDLELANKIFNDEIDVIIELNQMTAMTRATVLAYRPAPIQIQWLGMPGTLGAGADVDYVIVDPWVISPENQGGFSEKLLCLSRSYQPNDHIKPIATNEFNSREEAGLPSNGVILGVFNQYYKFSPDTLKLWGEIFKQLDNTYLWLMEPKTEQLKERIIKELAVVGIKSDQIIFAGFKSQEAHLARLKWMDLVLDTWPYNAHTTCSDALRVGVPVLTLPGKTFASRVASGILHTSNLKEWVAHNCQEYVSKAVKFAKQSSEDIDAQKNQVKETYWSSQMVDNQALGLQIEAICLGLFEQFRQGLLPSNQRLTPNLKLIPLILEKDQIVQDESTSALHTAINIEPSPKDTKELISIENHEVEEGGEHFAWSSEIRKGGGQNTRLSNYALLSKFILNMESKPLVVDIGAADLGEDFKFNTLADSDLVSLVGFEADEIAFRKLIKSKNRRYIPDAIGDGQKKVLHLCYLRGMNSILEPDLNWLDLFPMFKTWAQSKSTVEVQTTRLDDIEMIRGARYAKFDIQGAEGIALEHGTVFLKDLAFLHIETSPTPLYKDEKNFFQIGQWLMERGFIFHTFINVDKRNFKPFGSDEKPYGSHNHIFQLDAVFMPDPILWGGLPSEQLKALAFLSHTLLNGIDVSMRALYELDTRDQGNRVEQYQAYLDIAGMDA